MGGPAIDDNFYDARDDYYQNEVTCDYNSGFQSAVAGRMMMMVMMMMMMIMMMTLMLLLLLLLLLPILLLLLLLYCYYCPFKGVL